MTGTKEPAATAGSFFGRRKGKTLRPGHDRVDRRGPAAPARSHPGRRERDRPRRALPRCPVEAVRLEIGFGGGEHLASAARAARGTGFIGCEPFVNGVAKLLAVVEAEGLTNIRFWDGDAAELVARLPDGELDRVHILFPDPWPKRRQRKRRFVSDENFAALARVMRPRGRAALRHRHRRLCRLDARPHPALGQISTGRPESATDWRRTLAGLAGHALRGEGEARGAPVQLSHLRAEVSRFAAASGRTSESLTFRKWTMRWAATASSCSKAVSAG